MKNVVLPTIGLFFLAICFLVTSGLINTAILMSLSHTITTRSSNISTLLNQTFVCENDPTSIICGATNQLIAFYYESGNFSFAFFFGWAIALVTIEVVKFLIVISFFYGLYRIYLKTYLEDLVLLYTSSSLPIKEPENEYNMKQDNSDTEIDIDEMQHPRNKSNINFDDTTDDSE